MLNINSVTLMLLEHPSYKIPVHRKKTLFDCSPWQMKTTNSLTDISDYSMRLSIISNSLLITVISTFLHIFPECMLSGW